MTVTRDQAQMLATLAAACRPNGARRWDSAGTLAAIAQVKDRSLAEVVMATIRAAADRDVDTPGVIPSNGSHWQETKTVAPTPPPERVPPEQRCTICSHSREACRMRFAGDHEFSSVTDLARTPPLDTRRAVQAIKDELAAKRPPRVPEPAGLKAAVENSPRVAALKQEMAAARVAAAEALETDEKAAAVAVSEGVSDG